ncbi:hypothetical protein [Paracoccus sp. KR1-242]|uniref:hypothetical protein n=1 Tax=Paracoccus sp. KR1-242 TaxID=3410028 RepID=UPI003C01CA80
MSAEPRPMTLAEQASLIECRLRAWVEPKHEDRVAGCPIWLTAQDAEDMKTIAKTLRILGMHGADEYVRAKVARERKERARK